MNESKISVRYAKAFFELGIEKNKIDIFKQDLEVIGQALQIKEFVQVIYSPIIMPSEKKAVINSIFTNKIDPLSISFLNLLIENQRETFLPIIIKNYLKLYREYHGIKEVEITSAIEIDKEETEKIKAIISKTLNSQIELTKQTKPEILGGIIIRIEDKMLDMSVSTQLKNIKKQLLQ